MVAFRQDVAELWPRSASAFAALGLDVNVYGLEFYDLAVERDFDGATPILLVSGEVRNIGRDDKLVPPVRISLRDTRSHEIFELVNVVTDQPIAAGAAVPFQIRVENPPEDAVDLEATFASFSEMAFAGGPAHVSPARAAGRAAARSAARRRASRAGDDDERTRADRRLALLQQLRRLRVLLTAEEIAARVDKLADGFAAQVDDGWTVVALLQGAIPFAADLMRAHREARAPPDLRFTLARELSRRARKLRQGRRARRHFALHRRPPGAHRRRRVR